MNPTHVIDAAYALGVAPERIFGLAEEWEENFHPRKQVCEDFLNWYHHGITPNYVEDFVIDVLARRVNYEPKRT
jgi:hypothetical protein